MYLADYRNKLIVKDGRYFTINNHNKLVEFRSSGVYTWSDHENDIIHRIQTSEIYDLNYNKLMQILVDKLEKNSVR